MDISVTHGRLGADAADFIAKPRRLLIDNEWVEAKSGKRFAVFDPATSHWRTIRTWTRSPSPAAPRSTS